eukprot:TRINITY_DN2050_c0_g2_i1.p1 TRINITY_DN2050_c0_g2~~TRINITY_DN2050_c0_g2_i1.p1  ORF type:complete len:394 (+),score=166.92 TRINITY_DN2050_c0_g2_i1:56-1237(+)
MQVNKYEVIVVGGGVMGSSAAYYLAKRTAGQKRILLLEQFDFLHKRGSSHGESRIIRRTYTKEFYTKMMQDAYQKWFEIENEAATQLYTRTGGLDFGLEDSQDLAKIVSICQKFSFPYELLTPEAVAQRFPNINLPPNYIAIYQPEAGVLNATKVVGVLHQLARRFGAVLRDREGVESIKIEDDQSITVKTTKNTYNCSKLILAPGSWLAPLLGKLGINIIAEPQKMTIGYWKVQSDPNNINLYAGSRFPVFIHYSSPVIYGLPSIEYPDMIKVASHETGEKTTADGRSFTPDLHILENEVFKEGFSNWFKSIPNSKPEIAETCLYTVTPDGNFIIDHLPISKNIIVAGGCTGHAFKLGNVIGSILSDLALNGSTNHDISHFNIYRVLISSKF